MNNFWSTLSISVTGSVLLSGILVWLCREWISARLRKSIQHEYDVKLEGFKAGYQKVLDENRIAFSWWHEKQAEALQEIYAMLVECQEKYINYFERHYSAILNVIDFKLLCVAEMLKHLTVFIGYCNNHKITPLFHYSLKTNKVKSFDVRATHKH